MLIIDPREAQLPMDRYCVYFFAADHADEGDLHDTHHYPHLSWIVRDLLGKGRS